LKRDLGHLVRRTGERHFHGQIAEQGDEIATTTVPVERR
jgi:hypothetical protein